MPPLKIRDAGHAAEVIEAMTPQKIAMLVQGMKQIYPGVSERELRKRLRGFVNVNKR